MNVNQFTNLLALFLILFNLFAQILKLDIQIVIAVNGAVGSINLLFTGKDGGQEIIAAFSRSNSKQVQP